MDKFVERISSYNILNNLVPGAALYYLMHWYWNLNLSSINIVESVIVYYFFGMIISRIGSVIIEPICRKTKWVEFVDYNSFIMASKKDEKIEILSEANNTYRTMLSLFFVLIIGEIFFGLCIKFMWLNNCKKEIIAVLLFVLFAFSYKKQTMYVKSRVEKNLMEDKK